MIRFCSTIASDQRVRRILIAVSLLLGLSTALSLNAQSLSEAQVSADAFALQGYPQARILYSNQQRITEYLLALAPYRKVGGVWRNPEMIRAQGLLVRQTLELPATHSYLMGYEFYREQLEAAGASVVYECDARDCGSSNSWANNHFKVLQLYGSDAHQRYGVFSLGAQTPTVYAVLYAVRRGNNRVYVQVELLTEVVSL